MCTELARDVDVTQACFQHVFWTLRVEEARNFQSDIQRHCVLHQAALPFYLR